MKGKAFYWVMAAMAFAACTVPEIEQAFGPDMKPEESKKVIAKYCASCHPHKDFEAEAHLAKVQPRYDTGPYKGATECRSCHTYGKDWLMDVKRGTHRTGLRK